MKKKILTLMSVLGLFAAKVNADSFNYGIGVDGGVSLWGYKSEADKSKGAELGFPNWNAEAFGGMDFGDDGQEIAGFYVSGGFGGRPIDSEDKKVEVNLKGVTFGLGCKIMFCPFDGGNIYIKAGPDGYWSLSTDAKKGVNKESVKPFNVAGKLSFGVDLLDGGMSVGFGGRYWFLDLKDPKKEPNLKISLAEGQVDGNFFVGFNIAKLIE